MVAMWEPVGAIWPLMPTQNPELKTRNSEHRTRKGGAGGKPVFQIQSFAAVLSRQNKRRQAVKKGADMERERKQEYIGRLTLELLAYDSEAMGEAVNCRLSGADPDKLTAAVLEAYNTVLELETLKTDY